MIASEKALTAFLALISSCISYSFLLTGTGNLVVLLDTFLPAGLLAFVLCNAPPHALRHLRWIMQSMLVVNALLALAETASHATLVPLYLNDLPYSPHEADFRPTALFDHPLTGAVITLLGLALAPARGWHRLTYSGLMWAALLAYGGRMAVAAGLLIVCGTHFVSTGNMILYRHPEAAKRVVALAITAGTALIMALLVISLGLATRLVGHLYWDDSAQARLAQWQLLDHIDVWQWLFGTRREDLLALLVSLRLATGVEVIENFWLLMFVSLGLCGFPFFFTALSTLFGWCWQRSLLQGRLLLLSVLLVTSTSNSIGRKSTILVCMVAAIVCMPVRCTGRRRSVPSLDIHGLIAA